MEKISVMIPCFNEVENVEPISEAVVEMFHKELPQYDYEILFIDNASTDGTRDKLEKICASNHKIKAIFRFMACARLRVIVRFHCVVIFRIRWN